MTAYLLDVNVLIALIDPSHVHHPRAIRWFEEAGRLNWLSCPITENGAIRIICSPKYSNTKSGAAFEVFESLRSLSAVGSHRFVSDHVSILDPEIVDANAMLSSARLTDTYLLALAAAEGAALATFDRRLVSWAVRSEQKRVYLIP